jgi:DDE superfamily endonuclease
VITPFRKPAHRDLLDWEKQFNTQINKIRYVIERTIANFKTWRITHTDYRRPLKTFAETISTVIALHFFRINRVNKPPRVNVSSGPRSPYRPSMLTVAVSHINVA